MTVKVRLGFSDKSLTSEIAQAAEAGGGHWLTTHARTKEEGYRPPAHWEFINQMRELVSIPVIANGDIWNRDDHERCQKISGCEHTMLGRGIMACPDLALQIHDKSIPWTFQDLEAHLPLFMTKSLEYRDDRYAVQRTKQWVKLMGRTYQEASELFEQIKRETAYQPIANKVQDFFRNSETRPSEESTSKPQ